MKQACQECECALLKQRQGMHKPLHQCTHETTGDGLILPSRYHATSSGKRYCLMVGCYFSKWLECFHIPDQKATTIDKKLVYEVVGR